MKTSDFVKALNSDFYTGVPDSLLSPLCDYLFDTYGEDSRHHVIAANEGNAVGLAAGYHLATGKVPVVYLQNSGEGNIVNPVTSLLNDKVYGIPVIFIVGWRGEPGTKDEPQHIFQGEITISLLKELGVKVFELREETNLSELEQVMVSFAEALKSGRQVAFVVSKGALTFEKKIEYSNNFKLVREDILRDILNVSGDDIIVATTGKTGRELFELREAMGKGHEKDFLTVGSMGHASSIALGIALQKPDRRVWCIDGDGAALMHMGAFTTIGKIAPANLIHVVINNLSHESVGGLPTASKSGMFVKLAENTGYKEAYHVSDSNDLIKILGQLPQKDGPILIEIESAIGSRKDLGRPTTSPKDNKISLMKELLSPQ